MRVVTSSVGGVGQERVSVPEAAKQLGLEGARVYELVFAGDLDGQPADDGRVMVSVASIRAYAASQPAAG